MNLMGALAAGKPVVFTSKDKPPQVMLPDGKEKEALELLQSMKLIEIVKINAIISKPKG
jgi:hypothetical protein